MAITTIEEIYYQYIESLSVSERLQLMALITQQLVQESAGETGLKLAEDANIDPKNGDDLEAQKSSPKVLLQLAGTLSAKEADTILQAVQECRHIDWEMWEQAE